MASLPVAAWLEKGGIDTGAPSLRPSLQEVAPLLRVRRSVAGIR